MLFTLCEDRTSLNHVATGRTRADAFYEQGVRSLDDLEKLHQPDSKWSLDYYDDMQERMTRSDVESIRDCAFATVTLLWREH